jgi:hypothetical protein
VQWLIAESSLPPAQQIRRAAAEVVARPYFQIDVTQGDGGEPLWLRLLRLILKPFQYVFRALDGLPEIVRWLIVVLAIALCLAIIAHIIYTVLGAIRGPASRTKQPYIAPGSRADPETLERAAAERAAAGAYVDAVRLLMRAALRRIELAEKKAFRPGITNRQLLRSYQSTALVDPLRWFVDAIDRKFYGSESCSEADYVVGQHQHAQICRYVAKH